MYTVHYLLNTPSENSRINLLRAQRSSVSLSVIVVLWKCLHRLQSKTIWLDEKKNCLVVSIGAFKQAKGSLYSWGVTPSMLTKTILGRQATVPTVTKGQSIPPSYFDPECCSWTAVFSHYKIYLITVLEVGKGGEPGIYSEKVILVSFQDHIPWMHTNDPK